MCVCVYICVCMFIYIYMCVYIYVYIYVYICIYIYIYIIRAQLFALADLASTSFFSAVTYTPAYEHVHAQTQTGTILDIWRTDSAMIDSGPTSFSLTRPLSSRLASISFRMVSLSEDDTYTNQRRGGHFPATSTDVASTDVASTDDASTDVATTDDASTDDDASNVPPPMSDSESEDPDQWSNADKSEEYESAPSRRLLGLPADMTGPRNAASMTWSGSEVLSTRENNNNKKDTTWNKTGGVLVRLPLDDKLIQARSRSEVRMSVCLCLYFRGTLMCF
jgi:hypothetical protein